MDSKIESVQNEKIKKAVKLAHSSKARMEQGLFFLEGLRLCTDALNSSAVVDTVFYTVSCLEKHRSVLQPLCDAAKHSFAVSDAVADKLSQTQTTQGVFCLVRTVMIPDALELCGDGKYIALEQIQDPSNLGAICRTAEALGISGAVLTGCCDIYNAKALRASMGSLLRLPLFQCSDLPSLLQRKKADGMHVYAATPDDCATPVTACDMKHGVITVIGNEGNGLTKETLDVCDLLTIPMFGRAESLNASMAAAIVMWEMMRTDHCGRHSIE